ncbi:FtsX-like permease family protein [Compostibacter hankyongensis]|uniref:FtsX-like permease family protein n=1 Tax=Compostibacter hankyongensis TaxID=1007089 RepID=A0ABP8FXJ5_9BACT
MSLPAFIARRIAFNRERTFSRFIIRIAVAATALSVAVMILATALVNGFREVVSQKIFSFWGHIHITEFQPNAGPLTEELPFLANDTLENAIHALPGVQSLDIYATKPAILQAADASEGVIFKGVDRRYHWKYLQQYLIRGRLPQFPDSGYSQEIVISEYLARKLRLRVNGRPLVFFIQKAGEMPRARRLTVTGIYKTSIEEYDKTYIIGDIDLIRRLNDWQPNQVGGYEIMLNDYHRMDTVSNLIYDHILPDKLTSLTIRQLYPNIFDWLGLQDMNEVIIIVIMTIVAIINMITAILILILERTNMVGVLKALGMRTASLQKIFLFQSAYILSVGLLIGNIAGLGLAILEKQTGFFKLPEETYYMPVAPILIKPWQVILIDAGTLLICVLVLVIPSLLIRKVQPVKAITFK